MAMEQINRVLLHLESELAEELCLTQDQEAC